MGPGASAFVIQARRIVSWTLLLGMMLLGASVVSAQNYPNKPIRFVAAGAGGNGDFHARFVAEGISGSLGQQVIVENRGGSGIIPAMTVAKATPNGYTLLSFGSTIWLLPLLQDDVPYDPVKDFSPIILTTSSPSVLVVHPTVPVKSVRELIALAKMKPGGINYAYSGPGTSSHLAGELFRAMAGVDIVRIPYSSTGSALNDLIGGQVQVMFSSAASATPHIKSGRVRALAVTSGQPSALFPGLPTIAATGVPGYESGSMQGIWGPANTPMTVIKRLNHEVTRFLSRADVKERLLSTGVEAAPSTPEQFGAVIKSEMARMGKVIKDAGIRAE